MNTNQYSQAFQTQVPMSGNDYFGGASVPAGLSFQDLGGSTQDNYLQFTEFSQVGCSAWSTPRRRPHAEARGDGPCGEDPLAPRPAG